MTRRRWLRWVATVACTSSISALACSSGPDRDCEYDPQFDFFTDSFGSSDRPAGPCSFTISGQKTVTYEFACESCEAGTSGARLSPLNCVPDDPSAPAVDCEWNGSQFHARDEGDAAQAVFDYLGDANVSGEFRCAKPGSIEAYGWGTEIMCFL